MFIWENALYSNIAFSNFGEFCIVSFVWASECKFSVCFVLVFALEMISVAVWASS